MTRMASSAAALGMLVGLSLGIGGCVVAPPVEDSYYGPPSAAYAPPRPLVVAPPTVAVYPHGYYEDRVVVRPSHHYDHDRYQRSYHRHVGRWDRDHDRDHDHDRDD